MRTRKNIRLYIEIAIVVIFIFTAVIFLNKSNINNKLQMVLKFKTNQTQKGNIQLLSKNEILGEIKWRPKRKFKKIRFSLLLKHIKNLRISFGETPGLISIRSITIFNFANKRVLKGNEIFLFFKKTNLMDPPYLKNNIFHVNVRGPGNWIAPESPFYKIKEEFEVAKLISHFILLLFAVFLFFFLHNFNPGQLKIFLTSKVFFNGVFIVLLVLIFPLLNKFLNIEINTKITENRIMTRKPVFKLDSIFQYPKRYTAFYNDHFIFRNTFIFIRSLLKYKLFNISATNQVLIGKNGWLFLDDHKEKKGTIEYYRGITLFTEKELESWKDQLEYRYKWLKKRGIHYLFILAPNKNTIYPEFMPKKIRKVNKISRMDQLLNYLKRTSDIPFLDLRPALIKAKSNYPVYSKTDTHWNDYGGYIAYREIIKYLQLLPEFKDVSINSINNFKIKLSPKTAGDLSIMMSLHKEILKEQIIQLTPNNKWTFQVKNLPYLKHHVKQKYTRNSKVKSPSILFVHDSFYKTIKPFLSEQISLIRYIWDWRSFYPKIIKKMKPKLVIEERVERLLM